MGVAFICLINVLSFVGLLVVWLRASFLAVFTVFLGRASLVGIHHFVSVFCLFLSFSFSPRLLSLPPSFSVSLSLVDELSFLHYLFFSFSLNGRQCGSKATATTTRHMSFTFGFLFLVFLLINTYFGTISLACKNGRRAHEQRGGNHIILPQCFVFPGMCFCH